MVYVTHNRPLDTLLQLKDTTAAITSTATAQVGGVDVTIDLMPGAPAGAPAKFIKGMVLFDIAAIDVANSDEVYQMTLQGTNTAGWGGTVYELGRKPFGANAVLSLGVSTPVGRQCLYFDNVAITAAGEYLPQRYIRLRAILAGTTPSITYTAWMAKDC